MPYTQEQLADRLLRLSVSSILQNIGFQRSNKSSLCVINGLAIAFLNTINQKCAALAESANRSVVTLDDALLALRQMDVSIPALWDYLLDVECFPSKLISKFPVVSNDDSKESPLVNDAEFTPPTLNEITQKYAAQKKKDKRLGIDSFSESVDLTLNERRKKAIDSFPSFVDKNARSLGMQVRSDRNTRKITPTPPLLQSAELNSSRASMEVQQPVFRVISNKGLKLRIMKGCRV